MSQSHCNVTMGRWHLGNHMISQWVTLGWIPNKSHNQQLGLFTQNPDLSYKIQVVGEIWLFHLKISWQDNLASYWLLLCSVRRGDSWSTNLASQLVLGINCNFYVWWLTATKWLMIDYNHFITLSYKLSVLGNNLCYLLVSSINGHELLKYYIKVQFI